MRWARFDQAGDPTFAVVEGDALLPGPARRRVLGTHRDARASGGCAAAAARHAADVLRMWDELRRACERGGREGGAAAEPAGAAGKSAMARRTR